MSLDISIMEKPVDQKMIDRIKNDPLPVVICGLGEVGSLVRSRLESCGIKDIYYCDKEQTPGSILESEVDDKFGSYYAVAGYLQAYIKGETFPKLKNRKELFYFGEIHGYNNVDRITKDEWNRYADDYSRVYDALCDDRSRESYKAYLECKINEDAGRIKDLVETPQYFSGDFLKFGSDEVLVDCGAFTGDSIRDFLSRTNGKYERIYAFEPDNENAAVLSKYIEDNGLHDVEVCRYATVDKKCELRFRSQGILSTTCEDGDIVINAEAIDNVIGNNKVTYIKMDIEGSEMKALEGARNTISRERPVFGISAYHKADDTFRIMDFINECTGGGYKYYFRCHKPLPIDAVLYAVPKER